jgi:hypothetical protein
MLCSVISLISGKEAKATSITASYGTSTQNVGYEQYQSERFSAGFSLNLGLYFRLDFSHGQEFKKNTGYKELSTAEDEVQSFQYFESLTKVETYGSNLSVILYAGETFVPYIFGGVVRSVYEIKFVTEDSTTRTEFSTKTAPIVVPTGGIGIGLMLNRNFSLKMSHTLRPGVQQIPGKEAVKVYDTTTDVGLTYEFK